jgi:hypothetical protein
MDVKVHKKFVNFLMTEDRQYHDTFIYNHQKPHPHSYDTVRDVINVEQENEQTGKEKK